MPWCLQMHVLHFSLPPGILHCSVPPEIYQMKAAAESDSAVLLLLLNPKYLKSKSQTLNPTLSCCFILTRPPGGAIVLALLGWAAWAALPSGRRKRNQNKKAAAERSSHAAAHPYSGAAASAGGVSDVERGLISSRGTAAAGSSLASGT